MSGKYKYQPLSNTDEESSSASQSAGSLSLFSKPRQPTKRVSTTNPDEDFESEKEFVDVSSSAAQTKPESKEKISAQIVEQHIVEQQLQELLPAICVFDSSAVKGDKASLEGGEESQLLQYKVSRGWLGFGSLRLRGGFFPTKDKIDAVFPSIEVSVGEFNKTWGLKKKNKVVLEKGKIAERHYIEVTNLSKEILKRFPLAQNAFLKLHKDAQSEGSVHSYLEEEFLKKGDLSWGLTAIKELATQDLGEDNDKVNEIRDRYSPLQRALSWLLAIERPSIAEHKTFLSSVRKTAVSDYLREVIQILLGAPSLQITPISGERSPLEMAKKLGDSELIETITEQITTVDWESSTKTTSSLSSSVQSNPPQDSKTSSHTASRKGDSGGNLQQAPASGFFPKGEAKPVVLVNNSGDTTAVANEQLTTTGNVANETPAVGLEDNPTPASSVTANSPVY